jgi:membrane protease YdiL (CAAX protease family)
VLTTWPRTLLSAVIGVALIVFTYVVLPGLISADARKLHWSILASTGVYNYSTLLGGPLGEEPGWRGYALPRLEARLGPVRGTVLLAILWTGWHLPLFLMPGWTTASVWSFALIELGLSGLMTFGANLGRFAVIPCIAMHAAFNTVSRFLNGLFGDIQPNMKVPFEFVLGLCGVAMMVVLLAATKGNLMFRREQVP